MFKRRTLALLIPGVLAFLFGAGICLVSQASLSQAFGKVVQTSPEVSYDKLLEMRDDPDVVILDASEMEPLFWVVPESAAKRGKGLTQAELDSVLSEMIPSKDTRIVLYCYQNFALTRIMPARTTVALNLRENGYKSVYELEDLWSSENFSEVDLQKIAEKEVFPYTKKLPDSALSLLQRIRPGQK